jgi:hypothetical protein
VSVVLFDRQVRRLDRLTRGKGGKEFNRAEIIRALIDGFIDSELDLSTAASESELRAKIARRLGSPFR